MALFDRFIGEDGWICLPRFYLANLVMRPWRSRRELPNESCSRDIRACSAPTCGPGGKSLRWALNTWLVFHVAAIIVAPAAVSPSSELMQSIWGVFQPYLQVLYLNHGYHFFAPEPE